MKSNFYSKEFNICHAYMSCAPWAGLSRGFSSRE
jgi:hypothetical protein